ncbi:MAG TPA: aryl-sulfate sulfotransferase [Candidatus Kapabacteria bacterium]
MASKNTYLIDKCGKLVNKWTSSYLPGLSCYLLEDGSMIRAGNIGNDTFSSGGKAGIIEHFNWNGTLRWSYRLSNSTMCSHHDFKVMPNGNILAIAWQEKSVAEQLAAGRDPDNANTRVWSESIVELQPVGSNSANIVWQWDLWDHLVQDYDDTKPNFGVIADHPELVDLNFVKGGLGPVDWIHLNSIDYNEDLDQIVVSSFCFSEIWVIDHSTTTEEVVSHTGGNSGKGGDLLYRWGNPEAYGRGTSMDRVYYHQHNVQWVPSGFPNAGKLIVFNNGLQRPVPSLYSTVDIIAPPLNSDGSYAIAGNNPYGPTNLFWQYSAPVRTDLASGLISGAQPLQNGSILITSGIPGEFWEVNSSKKRVWKYIHPISRDSALEQGQTAVNNSVFRATFYPSNYPGFAGRTLVPGLELELEPTIPALCEVRTIATSPNSGSYCVGSSITARFTSDGLFFSDNIFYLELSDAMGSFNNPTVIGSFTSSVATTFNGVIPLGIAASTRYRYRVRSTHPAATGTDNGSNIKISTLPQVSFNVPNPYNVCNFTSPVQVVVSGGVSYQWNDGITTASRSISTPGKYYVTVTNSAGCERRDSIEVNRVISLPVKITATKSPTICDGSSVGLLASGASLYYWSTGDTTRLLTATKQGWYKVTGTDPSGCTGTDSIYVTVAPVPLISITPDGIISLCPGDTVTVVAVSASNYLWSTGDTTQMIRVSSSGTYYVSTTNGECPGLSTVLVVKRLTPPAKPIITRSGNMLTTDADLPLQWYHDGQLIVGATGKSYTPSTDGVFTVLTTGANNCSSLSDVYNYSLLDVAVDGILSANITISPNPFTDHISINIESPSAANYVAECYTVLGEKVSTIYSGMLGVGDNVLNYVLPKNNSEGVYFIRIRSGAFLRTFKIVRE